MSRNYILKYFIYLIISIEIQSLYAQESFNFSGYIVDFPYYQRTNKFVSYLTKSDQDQFINLTRLRLRPTLNLWSGSRFVMEYEISAVYLSSPTLFTQSNSNSNRQITPLKWNISEDSNFTTTHFIDRLYFQQNLYFGKIIIGRQRISWGTGRIWNPTDLFNPINPTNFGKIEKDGADAVSMVFNLGNFTDLSVVYNPQNKFKSNNSAFRFRTNFSEFDVSVIGGYFDDRIILGSDFAGNFFDAGVRGEGIISINKNDYISNFVKYILGIDYQFTSKLYGLIEYQFNGEGAIDKSSYNFQKLINGEILNLSKNYIFIQSTYLIHPLVSTSVSFNNNLNDGSGFIGVLASYSLSNESTITIGGQIFFGNDFAEYWYYPNSVYLKGEVYF